MKTSNFDFNLPSELIAQNPPLERGSSRLMVVDPLSSRQPVAHRAISDLPELVEPGTVLVVNDSKVRRARLYGRPVEGPKGPVEFLLVERLGSETWKAMCGRAKRQRVGMSFAFEDGVTASIIEVDGDLRILRFDRAIDDAWLDRFGHVPLPPYIKRQDTPVDAERYQTVYAERVGSIAAPTAGLHLTVELLDALARNGIIVAHVTLDVGLGTFLPIRTESVEAHQMHEETYRVSEETAELVTKAMREKRKVLAVGTTSVRTLESAWRNERLVPGQATTRLFIYPGYRFQVVNQVLTNFHTPGSSLIVMVSAFAGAELIKQAYASAIASGYRFFSYGDAMFIRGRPG